MLAGMTTTLTIFCDASWKGPGRPGREASREGRISDSTETARVLTSKAGELFQWAWLLSSPPIVWVQPCDDVSCFLDTGRSSTEALNVDCATNRLPSQKFAPSSMQTTTASGAMPEKDASSFQLVSYYPRRGSHSKHRCSCFCDNITSRARRPSSRLICRVRSQPLGGGRGPVLRKFIATRLRYACTHENKPMKVELE
jgi:hypothetical protein